ncbi:MAG: YdiY family protein [Gemmatimonadales bacterium]
MFSRRTPVFLGLLLAIPALAVAQDPPPKTRSFTADFGFVSAAGNTSVTTFNLGDKLVVNTPDKKVIFTQLFGAVRSEADGVKNAENYKAQLRLDLSLVDGLYLFGLTGWDRNVPAGVSRRFEETIGLAYKVLALPQDELSIEAGLSVFQQRNLQADATGNLDDNYKAGRAAAAYKHTFTKAAFFSQALELIPNFDQSEDFRLNSESAFVAPISSNIGLKLGYVIQFDNLPGLLPPPNPNADRLKKTDRFLTAGITVSY